MVMKISKDEFTNKEIYFATGADFDNADNEYHFIKIGKSTQPVIRCNKLRCKIRYSVLETLLRREKWYHEQADLFFDRATSPHYRIDGATEMWGRFDTLEDCLQTLENFRATIEAINEADQTLKPNKIIFGPYGQWREKILEKHHINQ